MLPEELADLVSSIRISKAESQTLELKAAHQGCPKRLYDTLSAFANQDEGGVIVFGVDENSSFEPVGVYDVQDLQKHVAEQCEQMEPKVRAVFTSVEVEGKWVVSAEVPALDVAERPCFYSGKGRLKGSYVRVGDSDSPMSEYEVYSFTAFRKKYQDELQLVERAQVAALSEQKLARYLLALRSSKPNLAKLGDEEILELLSVERGGTATLAGVMLFALYPQAYFPQLAVVATVPREGASAEAADNGIRFVDNDRIEGTLDEQLHGTLAFVQRNMRSTTVIDPKTGARADRDQFPLEAVREIVLNALIHRDYSVHTQGMPVQVELFSDRLVVTSPGGLYGRLTVDTLGKVQPDTRNPVIATAMETLRETENRYSGIPTVRRLMREAGLPEPEFENVRGEFRVTLRSGQAAPVAAEEPEADATRAELVAFCGVPRSRREIAEHLGIQQPYAMRKYVTPLVESGVLHLDKPDAPRSRNQRYYA